MLVAIVGFVFVFMSNAKIAHAAFQTYYIEAVIDYNTLIISRFGNFYKADFGFGCSFSSYSDEDKSILIDSFLSPSYGDDVVYERISTQTCSVVSSDTLSLSSFTIESVLDGNTLVLSRLGSYYETDFSYGCLFSYSDTNKIVQIDSLFSPGYGDTVIFKASFSSEVCSVSSSSSLNIRDFIVVDDIAFNKVLLQESNTGTKYSVEYGTGCLSLSFYLGTVKIHIGGVFLDGFGDKIYLFNKDQSCKVLDADILITTPISGSLPSQPTLAAPSSSLPTQPSSTPAVLGEETMVPTIAKLTTKNGDYQLWVGTKRKTIKPFGDQYKGQIFARKIYFGSDKIYYLFVAQQSAKDGQFKIYNSKGKVLASRTPFRGSNDEGLSVDIKQNEDVVYFVVSGKVSKQAQVYILFYDGSIFGEGKLTISSNLGEVIARFKMLRDELRLVTFIKGKKETIKVWKFLPNQYSRDKSFTPKDFRISGDKISLK